MKFSDIRSPENHKDAYKSAGAMLAQRLEESALQLWHFGETAGDIPRAPQATDECFLVGVFVWNNHDLRLLDTVNEALTEDPAKRERITVAVFNLDGLVTRLHFDRYFPGADIKTAYHSPLVAHWKQDVFQGYKTGDEGRCWVSDAVK